MRKLTLLLLSLVAWVGAVGPAAWVTNWTGYADTTMITTDSIRLATGRSFASTENENKVWIFAARDTANAGFASDSISFLAGYQRGYIVFNTSWKPDTTWRAVCWLDTFHLVAGNILLTTSANWQDTINFAESLARRMIDTSNVTGYAVMTVPCSPVWSPIVRPAIQGLAGQRKGSKVKILVTLEQRAYSKVKAQ